MRLAVAVRHTIIVWPKHNNSPCQPRKPLNPPLQMPIAPSATHPQCYLVLKLPSYQPARIATQQSHRYGEETTAGTLSATPVLFEPPPFFTDWPTNTNQNYRFILQATRSPPPFGHEQRQHKTTQARHARNSQQSSPSLPSTDFARLLRILRLTRSLPTPTLHSRSRSATVH